MNNNEASDDKSENCEKPVKRARYACTFKPKSNTFEWTRRIVRLHFGHDISITYGGMKDLKKHESTAIHKSSSVGTSCTLIASFS